MGRRGIPWRKDQTAMQPIFSFCALGLLTLLLTGCGAEMAGPGASGTARRAGTEQAIRTTYEPSGKANFVSPKGAFEIWFPARPSGRSKDEEGVSGEFYSLKQNGREYFAGFVEHDRGSMSDLVLRRAVRSTEERLEGSLTTNEPIWFQGNEGREFILREPAESRTIARYYNLGPRLYMTRFTGEDHGFSVEEAREFLDSFNILADPGARLKDGQSAAKVLTPSGR